MNLVFFDAETYFASDYSLSLKTSTMVEYVRDPRFKLQCYALRTLKDKNSRWYPGTDLKPLRAIDWDNTALVCHHAHFDGLILAEHYGIVPAFYFCTLAMARGVHGSKLQRKDLDSIARFYKVGNKLPNVLMKTKGIRDLPPDLLDQLGKYCAVDNDLCSYIFKRLYRGYPEAELRLIDQVVRMYTDPRLMLDAKILKNYLRRERAAKTRKVNKGEVEIEVLQSAEKFAEALRDLGVEPPTKRSQRTGEITYAFAQTDAAFTALLENDDDRVASLVAARLAVKSTIGETRALRLLGVSEGGTRAAPVYLNYGGAHTTRLSGGDRTNFQNLTRGSDLRRSVHAPPGHVLVVGDLGQIEARTNGWLSGQTDLLENFARYDEGDKTHDPYRLFASKVYLTDPLEIDSEQRFVGKTCILGLGFEMGPPKLQYTLALGINGPEIHLPIGECMRLVTLYRGINYKIAGWWRWVEKNILPAMLMGRAGEYKCIAWDKERLILPSGLSIHYPHLKLDFDEQTDRERWTYAGGKRGTINIYGGKLVENIVQAVARCIITDHLLEIADQYKVVLFTHDEIVACVPKKQADAASELFTKVMRTAPKWMPGIPLNLDLKYAEYYSK